jgi:hypothetical protein
MLPIQIRWLWTLMQFAMLCALLAVGPLVWEMVDAEPQTSYVNRGGQVVRCEAVVHARGPEKTVCATFGSKETNPGGFAAGCVLVFGILAMFSWAGGPGRGLMEASQKRKPR